MKKVTLLLVFAVFATAGLTAQDKDQVKLKLKDGSCLDLYDSELISCDRLLLKDGSGSRQSVYKVKGKAGDKNQIRLHDDSCLVEDGFAPQFLNLFNRFKK